MHKRLISGLIYAGIAIVTAIATFAIRANDKPQVLDIAPTWHDEIVLGETVPETVPEITPESYRSGFIHIPATEGYHLIWYTLSVGERADTPLTLPAITEKAMV